MFINLVDMANKILNWLFIYFQKKTKLLNSSLMQRIIVDPCIQYVLESCIGLDNSLLPDLQFVLGRVIDANFFHTCQVQAKLTVIVSVLGCNLTLVSQVQVNSILQKKSRKFFDEKELYIWTLMSRYEMERKKFFIINILTMINVIEGDFPK